MKKVNYILSVLGIVASVSFASMPILVNAQPSAFEGACSSESASTLLCQKKEDDIMDSVKKITNTLLFILGAISVLVIIISGFMYILSGGDASAVTKAKNTLFYAIIGVVVAIFAYAIVNFVVSNIG